MKRATAGRRRPTVNGPRGEAAQARQQLAALSQILEAIDTPDGAESLERVLQTVVDSAVRLCRADEGSIFALEDGWFRELTFTREGFPDQAAYEAARQAWNAWRKENPTPLDHTSLTGRVLLEGRSVRIADIQTEPGYVVHRPPPALLDLLRQLRAPGSPEEVNRSVLGVPLRRQGAVVGVLVLRRKVVAPFSDEELATVETFARPAAIAIQNARLFNETKEALEQQTATADVLRVISRSTLELSSVLQAVLAAAARLCDADYGWLNQTEDSVPDLPVPRPDLYTGRWSRVGAFYGRTEELQRRADEAFSKVKPIGQLFPMYRETATSLAILDRKVVNVPDFSQHPELRASGYANAIRARALLVVPLLREQEAIGAIALARLTDQAFTERDVALAQTFADQAVIAIENVRLFNDTKRALERQTAIAEVLRTIGRSSFDLDDVLDTVLSRAATLVAADLGSIYRRVGDGMRLDARFPSDFPTASMNEIARNGLTALVNYAGIENEQGRPSAVPKNDVATAIAFREGRTVHVPDVPASAEFARWEVEPKLQWYTALTRRLGIRAELAVPLKRDDQILGIIDLARAEPKPFSPDEIALLETFADQASIAIDSVRMFNEIQEQSAQLAAASQHKSEFLANMSHELRTPLNAIIGFSEVLAEGMFGPLGDKQREYLEDIRSSGQHLLSLINDVLDLSKVEAGRMELELAEVSLAAVVDEALLLVRERAAGHGITLAVEVPPDLPPLTADARKLKQALLNLVTNAVKFTPDGGWVAVTARREADDLLISVRDTGVGIAPDDQARIFEEFRQAKRRDGSVEGTGLGLALTKRIVELHGGGISVESELGKGSTFTVRMPLRPAAVAS